MEKNSLHSISRAVITLHTNTQPTRSRRFSFFALAFLSLSFSRSRTLEERESFKRPSLPVDRFFRDWYNNRSLSAQQSNKVNNSLTENTNTARRSYNDTLELGEATATATGMGVPCGNAFRSTCCDAEESKK